MNVTTEVLEKLPARFDMTGRFLGYPLRVKAGATIKPGLVKRLVTYATSRMEECGLAVPENVTVCTMDEGIYFVEFLNAKGCKIILGGIMLNRGGWPSLDHRFSIEEP